MYLPPAADSQQKKEESKAEEAAPKPAPVSNNMAGPKIGSLNS